MLFWLMGVLWLAQGPANAEQAELEKLQGRWRVVKVAYDGITETVEGDRMLTITGNRFMPSDDVEDVATVKLVPAKKPGWLDLTDRNQQTAKGIYHLKGNELKIAVQEGDGDRPEKFEAPAKTKIIVLVLERVKN
jgi:uncharacterized protein (TIGR03067 family)